MTDIDEALVGTTVDEALEADTFDVFEYFSGASLPKDKVTIYRDIDAAYELSELLQAEEDRKERAKTNDLGITDDDDFDDELEDKITELHQRLTGSGVTFYLQGIAPAARDALYKGLQATHPYKKGGDNPEFNAAFNANIVAKSILRVENAKGAVDEKSWTPDRVTAFTAKLADSEQDKLLVAALKLAYIGDAIDRAVSADFS